MPKISDLPTRTFDYTETFPCSVGGTTYGVTLPNETTSSLSISYDGFTVAKTTTGTFVRKGSIVVASFTTMSGTSNTDSLTSTTAIPVGYRPIIATSFCVPAYNNSVNVPCLCYVDTNGIVSWAVLDAGLLFTPSGTKGFSGFTVTYIGA